MYWGKVIGTLAGLATTKPVFALLGLFLGHQFDRGFEARYRNFREQGDRIGSLSGGFHRALFRSMGHLAKIDGRVSENEIRAARSVMHRLGLGPAEVRDAIGWFNEGKDPGFRLIATLREVRGKHARRTDARALFLRLVLEVSLAKNRLQQPERSALWTICRELDIGRVELAQLEAMIRAQRGFRRSPAGDADSERVRAAYRTLGVDASATNEEVRTAYRRLMSRNHPDKLEGSDPDAAVKAEAERRTREVRRAWELLKTRRSIR